LYGVAEKAGDIDHHITDERLQFAGIVAQLEQIIVERFETGKWILRVSMLLLYLRKS
jgi:hypothetical protein